MKMILQKHTSKFVAGLFNSLGITACVALTSCGDQDKDKQSENQGEELKNDLKNVEFYKKLADDEDSLKVIAEWLNNKNYGSDYKLNAKDLQEIFNNNPDKLNEVAGKLEVKLTESDSNRDDENQKSGITLKIDSETTDFVFDTIKDFQKFGKVLVDALGNDKKIQVEGEWSLIFEKDKVKICGHKVGFDYIQNFKTFLDACKDLMKYEKFQVPKFSLEIKDNKLFLNGVDCVGEYYKTHDFWGQTKSKLFFKIVGGKFEIEKNDKVKGKINGKDEATVTINGFESSLPWKWVVDGESNAYVVNSGWGEIFKLKGEEESAKEVTVKFDGGKYYMGDDTTGVELKDLAALEKLVEDLKDKKVTIGDNKNFSLAFEGEKVKVCGHATGVGITSGTNFATLLKCVAALKGEGKAIEENFKIKIAVASSDIQLNGKTIDNGFMKTKVFWDAVKEHQDLFDKLPIKVMKGDDNKGKIGDTVIDVEMFKEENIVSDWDKVFEKGK